MRWTGYVFAHLEFKGSPVKNTGLDSYLWIHTVDIDGNQQFVGRDAPFTTGT